MPPKIVEQDGQFHVMVGDQKMGSYATRADAEAACAQMAEPVEIEVFATGQHGGLAWTESDLDQMVANFAALGDAIKPPLKLGHDNGAETWLGKLGDGAPAFGWVAGLRRSGEKLMAQVKGVPAFLRELVAQGRYKRVSSELYPKWEATSYEENLKTGVKGKVLSAVALLGAAIPEVKSLADLPALLASEGATLTRSWKPPTGTIAVLFGAEPLPVLLAGATDGPPKPYGDVKYAWPSEGKYPIDTEEHIRAAWSYANKNDAPAHVKAAIVAAWKKTIDPKGPPSAMAQAIHATGDLMPEDAAALKAELEALKQKDAAREVKLTELESAAKAAREREAAAEARVRVTDAKRFVEEHSRPENLRILPAERKFAEALFLHLAAAPAEAKVTLSEDGKSEELSPLDCLRGLVGARPDAKHMLRELSVAQEAPKSGPQNFNEAVAAIAKRDGLDLSKPDDLKAASVKAFAEHEDLAPDHKRFKDARRQA